VVSRLLIPTEPIRAHDTLSKIKHSRAFPFFRFSIAEIINSRSSSTVGRFGLMYRFSFAPQNAFVKSSKFIHSIRNGSIVVRGVSILVISKSYS
jgi:hypothetical protein